MMVGFACALPTLQLDSRFRGNGRTGGRLRQNGGFGLCVRNSLESLFDKEGLREFGGVRGLIHPHAMMVQQDAAGSLRVSLNSPFSLCPPRVGDKGG
jgi:hypothetical protein